jgi:aldehyde dehydrogenase (NAD+)
MWEYLRPIRSSTKSRPVQPIAVAAVRGGGVQRDGSASAPLDRTHKLYIGGRQVRPDQGYSLDVHAGDGRIIGQVGHGNRKDVRDAVEAAHRADGWMRATAQARAQVLYFIAENLTARHDDFSRLLAEFSGTAAEAAAEVDAAIERLFHYAAWADKWDGAVHATPFRNVTMALHEAIGVIGIVCPDANPLLGYVSSVVPAVAMGNTVVTIPSERFPLAACELYQVLDTSDVPGGVVNIVTGPRAELGPVMAAHDDVDGLWYFAADGGGADVERLAAGNMKRTWVGDGDREGMELERGEDREFLRHATQVKNIWIPYGE